MSSFAIPEPCTYLIRFLLLTHSRIRVSLYVLTLSNHLCAFTFNSAELSTAIESSLGVTGLAFFLTTVIITARRSFDLFHALCVFNLLGMVGLSARPVGRYRAGVVRHVTFLAFYVLAATGSLVYLIYVFATAPTFGDRPECNSRIVYVLFGVDISATNPVLRWLFVGALAFLLVGLGCSLLFVTCVSVDMMFGHDFRDFFGRGGWDEDGAKKRPSVYQLVSYVAGTIYLAVMLELMIRRNPLGPGLEEWTFGQVLAMTMLVGPLIELGSLLLGKVDGRGSDNDNNQLISIAPRARQRIEMGSVGYYT
ncbi:uncharacterized protein P884DRAFT_282945 [Thermothelomyces heterothallicus CBS 202.75]|uniref:uncharacterized protein n=1 Tax=Thermothelomyces heterothallicus CBS 202.75 TaxID=1149848 RepID=UPI0037442820